MPPSTHAVLTDSSSVDRLSQPINFTRAPRQWPAALAALEVRNYRMLLTAQAIGATGGWMQRVAQDWMVLQLTGSVAAVGMTVALQFLPFLLFGLFAGVIADRFPKKMILLLTQSASAVCALVLGLLALLGVVQAWHVYVIAFVFGLVQVVDGPARSAFVTELVGQGRIRNAVSLNSSVFHSAALLGPALSGILIGGVGLGWSFVANAVAAALTVVVVSQIRPTVTQLPTPASQTRGQLREGLAYIRRTSEVRWSLIMIGVASLLAMNMAVVVTAYADKVFHLGVHGYTVLTSLNAVGALVGAIYSASRRQGLRLRELALLLGSMGLLLAVASHMPNAVLYGTAMVIVGIVTLVFLIGANSLVQTKCAPAVRGRVMAVYMLIQLGLQAVGSPILGAAMDHFGPQNTMLACGASTAVAAAVLAHFMAKQSHLHLEVHRPHRADFHFDPVKLGRLAVPFITPRTVRRILPVDIVSNHATLR